MGYSHTFKQKKHCPPEQWAQITDAFKKLLASALITSPLYIQRENDDASSPEVTENEIIFNGIGNDGHETMFFSRNDPGYGFCKTANKPYDRVVVALLMLANHYAPYVWEIESDGDYGDWKHIQTWLLSMNFGLLPIPVGILMKEVV